MDSRSVDRLVSSSGILGLKQEWIDAFRTALEIIPLGNRDLPGQLCVWFLREDNGAMALPGFHLRNSGCIVVHAESFDAKSDADKVHTLRHELAPLHVARTNASYPQLCAVLHEQERNGELTRDWIERA